MKSTAGYNISSNGYFSSNRTNLDANGKQYYVDTNIAKGNYQVNLSAEAVKDYNNRSINYTFGLYFPNGIMADEESYNINSTSAKTGRPFLLVEKNCMPTPTGNWEITTYCLVSNEQVELDSSRSLIISSTGFLDLQDGSNVSFTGSNQYIAIAKGGELNVCRGCSLPK